MTPETPYDTNPGMRSARTAFLLAIFLGMLWPSAALAESSAAFNVDIPPGKWKSLRLRNLPKDAVVAVQVVSSGEITVALVDSRDYERFSETSRPLRPLFVGRSEKRLAFSVSIPVKGDCFLILDNRSGQQQRSVTAAIRAAPAGPGQTKSVEEILKKFEQQLHQVLVFQPSPMNVKKCGSPKAFAESPGIVLCEEYVHHLFDVLKNKQRTQDVLSFSIFHEVARVLLAQWNHPSSADENVADEFATVLMVMFNQKERAIASAEYLLKNPSISETLGKLFGDGRHPPSAARAKSIAGWAKDPQLVLAWQKFLVLHMQTALLKKLRQQPTSWTDLPLVEKELAQRSSGSKTAI